ncbi:AAA family ATPase [Blautia sp. An249]|uniref:AAA family ATPase n=1 Tax=Blautia sp. An249 TaxID=1965603 RepID=UPI000B39B4C7|nr:MoxR family ATPase [Blautia sp. An249]OUO80592.1 AAA family ATPase [Blautia sp. An249]
MLEKITAVREELKKVIIGKEEITDKILMAILARGHILLDDIPGVGKTTTALTFSKALGLDFKRIQFTPDVVPSDVTGFSAYDKALGEFRYYPGAVMCNMLLADEINRTSSKTQSALLEVMAEGNVTVDGQTYQVPAPFVVIATQNPVGTAGTQMLPESQLDRFMICLNMGYPDRKSQINLLRDRQGEDPLDQIQKILNTEDLINLQEEVSDIYVSDEILGYITDLTEATRNQEAILLGVSPRGALALCRMSKACAYLQERDYVVPDDVREVFASVCGHRTLISPKARIAGMTQRDLLEQISQTVTVPKI